MGPQVSEEEQALQQAIASNVPAAEIRKALAAYRASRKVLQDNLETAQANLKKVLTAKQEAQAVLLGLLT
jgi:Spy/CpxP family protein refolding chaperone